MRFSTSVLVLASALLVGINGAPAGTDVSPGDHIELGPEADAPRIDAPFAAAVIEQPDAEPDAKPVARSDQDVKPRQLAKLVGKLLKGAAGGGGKKNAKANAAGGGKKAGANAANGANRPAKAGANPANAANAVVNPPAKGANGAGGATPNTPAANPQGQPKKSNPATGPGAAAAAGGNAAAGAA
ncbi:hypothetical protein CSUB01_11199 [Colletotrichum sublineola]|uniref:Uncharacterized protein n=1 Tax=Colletotrichum sublineola TaxID=1173701 RepID=A0A066XZD4_COLSU|nr:hypothetical protein CSUB01_11199 [Colletotrichum sublineola]